jgi:hypothetical protein
VVFLKFSQQEHFVFDRHGLRSQRDQMFIEPEPKTTPPLGRSETLIPKTTFRSPGARQFFFGSASINISPLCGEGRFVPAHSSDGAKWMLPSRWSPGLLLFDDRTERHLAGAHHFVDAAQMAQAFHPIQGGVAMLAAALQIRRPPFRKGGMMMQIDGGR